METTTNYGLGKPGQDEFYDVDDFNRNMDVLDEALKKCSDKVNAPMEAVAEFEQADVRENIASGEKLKITFGKIAKFFADLKKVAFTGNYIDLSNKPDSLKNPYALKANGKLYDGSENVDIGTIGVKYGGTGGTTEAEARANLGLGAAATYGVGGLTTTEDNFLLPAKDGKKLQDDVDQLYSNLFSVTSGESSNQDTYYSYTSGEYGVLKFQKMTIGNLVFIYGTFMPSSNQPCFIANFICNVLPFPRSGRNYPLVVNGTQNTSDRTPCGQIDVTTNGNDVLIRMQGASTINRAWSFSGFYEKA